MPMTRLQITPEREQGRTKRKAPRRRQPPSTENLIVREVNRLQIRAALLGDGRRRRRRRRRGNADDVVDGSRNGKRTWNENNTATGSGDGGAGGGLGVAVVDVLEIVDRYYGGAFGAVGEGVVSGAAATTREALRGRDTPTSGSSTVDDRLLLVTVAPDGDQDAETRGDRHWVGQPRQHAAVPHGQEMEGLSVAGSRRGPPGGHQRSIEPGAGSHTGEP